MTTAAQLVKAIAQEVMVQASEAPIEADESNDIIFAMNNFMFALDARGVSLGYTAVSDLGDTITVPAGAMEGIVANVALKVASQFGAPIPPSLPQRAQEGMNTLEHLGVTVGEMSYGDTTPKGSGNEDDNYNASHFYPDEEDEILSEINGSILVEDNT